MHKIYKLLWPFADNIIDPALFYGYI